MKPFKSGELVNHKGRAGILCTHLDKKLYIHFIDKNSFQVIPDSFTLIEFDTFVELLISEGKTNDAIAKFLLVSICEIKNTFLYAR